MSHTLSELGQLCDRAAGKLYDRPADDDALADIATILLLVSSRLRRAIGPPDAALGHSRRLAASAMALASVNRSLGVTGGLPASDGESLRRVNGALRLVVRVLSVMQDMPRSHSAALT